ncbi:olfactory receptor 14I1-like [Elgaria multicarinata webbii]|uniref:olfactory receptor 14I1-like n=1 Tax=Elgaria multicarinata webbii TaxID=159646 RepID=UPI002FCD398B
MSNQSIVTEFLLLEFSDIWELQILYFAAFFIIYLTSLTGNLLVTIVVAFNHSLHTPMYFFLVNLSMVDLGYISVTIPKAITNSLLATWQISYSECLAQVFFFIFFVSSEIYLLTVMAYDRYVAICNPLQYEQLMNKTACIRMVASVWIVSLFNAALHTTCTFAITFCSNVINQFFCEIPQLLQISCSKSYDLEDGAVLFSTLFAVACFAFIIISYLQIFKAVQRIPSLQGRKKAISTCLPHLLVLFLFYFTGCTAFLGPIFTSSGERGLVLTVMYITIPPSMNPIIYSIRNKEILTGVWRLLGKSKFCNFMYKLGVSAFFFKKRRNKQKRPTFPKAFSIQITV